MKTNYSHKSHFIVELNAMELIKTFFLYKKINQT